MKTEIFRCDRCKKEQSYTALILAEFRMRIRVERHYYCDEGTSFSFQEYDFCVNCEDEFLKVMDNLTTPK